MIKRPKHLTTTTPFNLRGKFNSILEERLHDVKDHHRIMSIEVRSDEFDQLGNLTTNWKWDFWSEVNRAIQNLDANDIMLRPRQLQPPPTNLKQNMHEQ